MNKPKGSLLWLLGWAGMLTPLAIDMYLPAMPSMAVSLAVAEHWIQLSLSLFVAGFALGQLLLGPLSDSFGRKPFMLIGMLGFALSSLLIAFSSSVESLLFWRLIQGLFAAGPAVLIAAILRDQVQQNEFARMMSLVTLVLVLAPLVAPLLGTLVILLWQDWHWIFMVLAVNAFICLLVMAWLLPESLSKDKRQPLNLSASFADFGQLLTTMGSLKYILLGSLPFASMFIFLTLGSFVYIGHFGLSELQFSLLFAANVLALMLMTWINSRLVRRFGAKQMLTFGLWAQLGLGLIMLLGALLAGYLIGGVLWLAVPLALFVGMVSFIGANALACLYEQTKVMPGTVASLAGASRFALGGVIGLLVSLLAVQGPSVMALAMLCCPLASLLILYLLPERQLRAQNA